MPAAASACALINAAPWLACRNGQDRMLGSALPMMEHLLANNAETVLHHLHVSHEALKRSVRQLLDYVAGLDRARRWPLCCP